MRRGASGRKRPPSTWVCNRARMRQQTSWLNCKQTMGTSGASSHGGARFASPRMWAKRSTIAARVPVLPEPTTAAPCHRNRGRSAGRDGLHETMAIDALGACADDVIHDLPLLARQHGTRAICF